MYEELRCLSNNYVVEYDIRKCMFHNDIFRAPKIHILHSLLLFLIFQKIILLTISMNLINPIYA